MQQGVNRSELTGGHITLLVMVLGIVAFWVGVAWWDRRRNRQPRPEETRTTGGLFDDLCRVHKLTLPEKTLLTQVATALSQPAVVFTDPANLSRYAAAQPESTAACAALSQRLFGAN